MKKPCSPDFQGFSRIFKDFQRFSRIFKVDRSLLSLGGDWGSWEELHSHPTSISSIIPCFTIIICSKFGHSLKLQEYIQKMLWEHQAYDFGWLAAMANCEVGMFSASWELVPADKLSTLCCFHHSRQPSKKDRPEINSDHLHAAIVLLTRCL